MRGLAGKEVGEGDAVEVIVHELLKLFPDRERRAGRAARARRVSLVQAGDRGQRALRQAQHLAERVLLGLPAQTVAAALAAQVDNQVAAALVAQFGQRHYQLLIGLVAKGVDSYVAGCLVEH